VEGLAFPGLRLHMQKSKADHATACWDGVAAALSGGGTRLALGKPGVTEAYLFDLLQTAIQ
jgi:hypothetical protein